jgi:hypothetical protein
VVEEISAQTVQRLLVSHKLKPWRHHLELSPRVPPDATFAAQVTAIVTLYTPPLGPWEGVLGGDEKTRIQPRPRQASTRAAQPGQPIGVEHEYARKGALNRFAGFDTPTGTVYATPAERQRQVEFIIFLGHLDREIALSITTIHVVLDKVRMRGQTGAGLAGPTPTLYLAFPARALFLLGFGRVGIRKANSYVSTGT